MATKLETPKLESSVVETLKTRVEEGAPQSETKLTINWDSPSAERAFATRGVRIAAQAMMRASGSIPAELSVSVSELAKRERGGFAMKPSAANARRLMVKLDDAEYAAALVSIGIPASDVKRLVAQRATVGVVAGKGKSGPVTVTKVGHVEAITKSGKRGRTLVA